MIPGASAEVNTAVDPSTAFNACPELGCHAHRRHERQYCCARTLSTAIEWLECNYGHDGFAGIGNQATTSIGDPVVDILIDMGVGDVNVVRP